MKKLLILLFSILISFNSYGEVELDFSLDTFCDQSPKAQVRNGLFYLPNQQKPYSGENLCVYLSNGQYYSQGDINKGLRTGEWTYWKKNGQREKVEYYKDGEIVGGIHIEYWDNGQRYEEYGYIGEKSSWLYDNLDGKYTMWYENGQIAWEGNHKGGKENGKWTGWFENGQKSIEYNYNNLIPDGKWTSWFKNGLQSGDGNFKDGTGKFIEFFENNQKKYEVIYKDGIGKETFWYEDGQKWFEITYKDGKKHGKHTSWNESGQINIEQIYKDGELVSEINHKAEREAKAKEAAREKELAELKAAREKELAELKAAEEEAMVQLATHSLLDAQEQFNEKELKAKEAEEKAKEAAKQKELAVEKGDTNLANELFNIYLEAMEQKEYAEEEAYLAKKKLEIVTEQFKDYLD